MRIAILWRNLSGYLDASFRALAGIPGVQLFVAYEAETQDAPFAGERFAWLHDSYRYSGECSAPELVRRLEEFQPEVLYVCSFHIRAYRAACKRFRGRALRVFYIDNQWRGTFKQRIGAFASSWYLRSVFDSVFACGERQSEWARHMGYSEGDIWVGALACDHPAFAAVHQRRLGAGTNLNRSFLFVGRLVKEKAIDVLVDAYQRYREMTTSPWPLVVAGNGGLGGILDRVPGIVRLGFVQPEALPELFAEAGTFVLPSRFEPWAAVIQEAAAAGLPIICSSECGASVHLVLDGYNGFVVPPGDARALTGAFLEMTGLDDCRRKEMGSASYSLSLQYTPERWARYFVEKILGSGRLPSIERFRASVICSAPGNRNEVDEKSTGLN